MTRLKELYEMVYGDMPGRMREYEEARREMKGIMRRFEGRKDYEELWEVCLEICSCGQELGWVMGFQDGVELMVECFKER